ncbi:MAG: AAA family ATPase [Deltaproteobacteria bacterium]|nr:AAA family ATPase [Deltaproteobacteria bacterium]MBF0526816.1 AAA family ATPase [Deltaproteobacteria bacterium]
MGDESYRLEKLTTGNYKNLALDPGVTLSNLNIFIGPNGSGKSNFIAALKFLNQCVAGRPGVDRGITAFQEAVDTLGGAKILDATMKRPATVTLAYQFGTEDVAIPSKLLKLELWAASGQQLVTINKEVLDDAHEEGMPGFDYNFTKYEGDPESAKGYYYRHSESDSNTGEVADFVLIGGQAVFNRPDDELALTRVANLGNMDDSKFQPSVDLARNLVRGVKGWRFYYANEMSLRHIKESEPKIGGRETRLSPSGDNLALVLENLINENVDFEEVLNDAMRHLLPFTRKVRPIRSGRMRLTLEWHVQGVKEPFYLNELSDGTIHMLCLATILLAPDLPSLLVIEEPEIGLHVAWMPLLAEWIKRASEQTQVIISTHSPDLLDQFTDSVEHVLCFNKKDQHHFSVRTMDRKGVAEHFTEGWELGDLYRVGDPDVGGWPW